MRIESEVDLGFASGGDFSRDKVGSTRASMGQANVADAAFLYLPQILVRYDGCVTTHAYRVVMSHRSASVFLAG